VVPEVPEVRVVPVVSGAEPSRAEPSGAEPSGAEPSGACGACGEPGRTKQGRTTKPSGACGACGEPGRTIEPGRAPGGTSPEPVEGSGVPPEIEQRIQDAQRLRLFLDYDGTLADFAPTPEYVEPQPEVVRLLAGLADYPAVRVTVISGRRLDHVEKLVHGLDRQAVPRILLAGTYGVELRLPDGERVDRVPHHQIRPLLEAIKPRWRGLIDGREGFFLEDKDWALAIHAKDADDDQAEEVLRQARSLARAALEAASSPGQFRILGGHKFLEIGPALAHKGKTVAYLLSRYPWPGALPVYVGDDDKDEEAFDVIYDHGGVAVRVCREPCDTQADARLPSPAAVRQWLATLVPRSGRAET